MSPIKGLSEARRVPRLGKVRLGIKITKKREDGSEYTYPSAVDYFVCIPELQKALGQEKPKELEIMFPTERETDFAPQWYRCYSLTRGLVCKGDGERCGRMVDKKTGDLANRDSKEVEMREMDCAGQLCPDYQGKRCKTVMNLMFLLPSVPGLGVWQIDTGSVNSIININSSIDFIRKVCKRIAFVPLILSLEPQQVTNPEDGKKKTVQVLTLRTKGTLPELMAATNQAARLYLSIPAPAVEEPPDDIEEAPVNGEDAQEKKKAKEEGVKTEKAKAPSPQDRAAMQKVVEKSDQDKAFDAMKSASQDGTLPANLIADVKQETPAAKDIEWVKRSIATLKYKESIFSLIGSIPFLKDVDTKSKDIGKVFSSMNKEQKEVLITTLQSRAESNGVPLD